MKGQTLLEGVLALGVIAFVLSGIAVTVAFSLNNANFGKNQSLATQHAQEGIEILRKIRNKDYFGFKSYSGNYCLEKGASSLPPATGGCTVPNIDAFIRSVLIEQTPGCAANVAKATVKVSWIDGKCQSGIYCHESKLISCLSTINPIQAP